MLSETERNAFVFVCYAFHRYVKHSNIQRHKCLFFMQIVNVTPPLSSSDEILRNATHVRMTSVCDNLLNWSISADKLPWMNSLRELHGKYFFGIWVMIVRHPQLHFLSAPLWWHRWLILSRNNLVSNFKLRHKNAIINF